MPNPRSLKFGVESVVDRYEPWEDGDFCGFYKAIRSHTLVDIIRCWELWDLVSQVVSIPGFLIEIGCHKGGSGAVIAKSAQRSGITDVVYLCDTFAGNVKGNPIDGGYNKDGAFSDASVEEVETLCKLHELSNVEIFEGIFPDDNTSIDGEIRFCHIDVDVYQSAKDCYEWIWPRLSVGGVLVYDDYGYTVTPGIIEHVNEIRKGDDRISVYNLNEHAVLIKTKCL